MPLGADLASPIAEVYRALRSLNASWCAEVGRPSGPGWLTGEDLCDATRGRFNDLLNLIGARAKTADRKTIAASFALRFGWASGMAIGPYLFFQCVPDIWLDNVAFQFRESSFLERTVMYEPRGIVETCDTRAAHPSMSVVPDAHALLRALRGALVAQSRPVVDALFEWSGFAHRATWGMLTSSWAAQFTGLWKDRDDQRGAAPVLDQLFAGDDVVAAMRPRMHAVEHRGGIRLYQRRASCCRYYLLPQGDLCASCPLVSRAPRIDTRKATPAAVPDGSAS